MTFTFKENPSSDNGFKDEIFGRHQHVQSWDYYKNFQFHIQVQPTMSHGFTYFFRSDGFSHVSSIYMIENNKEGQQSSCRFLLEPPSESLLLDGLMSNNDGFPMLMTRKMITSSLSTFGLKKLATVQVNLGMPSFFSHMIMILLQILTKER
jgi:hypothetical protein